MSADFIYGKKLRELRIERGLSQEEVALSADITTAYYGLIERGRANPSVALLEKICRVLAVRLSDIFMDNHNNILEIDHFTMQVIYQLAECTDQEKELILSVIKQMVKFKNLK